MKKKKQKNKKFAARDAAVVAPQEENNADAVKRTYKTKRLKRQHSFNYSRYIK